MPSGVVLEAGTAVRDACTYKFEGIMAVVMLPGNMGTYALEAGTVIVAKATTPMAAACWHSFGGVQGRHAGGLQSFGDLHDRCVELPVSLSIEGGLGQGRLDDLAPGLLG